MINICNKSIAQNFKNIRNRYSKGVHRKLTIFNQNDMDLQYALTYYEQREKLVHFLLQIFLGNNHLFILEWDHRHWKENFMRNTMIPIMTFLAPFFRMNLPSRVIHKPKNGWPLRTLRVNRRSCLHAHSKLHFCKIIAKPQAYRAKECQLKSIKIGEGPLILEQA